MAHQATAPSPPRLSLSALRVLGQGTFGRVWRMHCDAAPPSWGPGLAGSFLAVKEMWLNAFVGEPKELKILRAAGRGDRRGDEELGGEGGSSHIVRLIGSWRATHGRFFIVMESFGLSLRQRVHDGGS